MEFKVTKILDQGTDNPIINRIHLQFSEMISCGFFWIEEEKQKEFRGLLFNLMGELLKIEKSVNNYTKAEDAIILKINSPDGIKYQKNGFLYDDPTIELNEKFEDFLIKSVVSIRKFVKVCSYIINKNFDGHKALYKYISNNFKPETSFYKWFEVRSRLVKEIYDLRGLVEHEELKIDKFEVKIIENRITIILPKIAGTELVLREYMQGGLKFLFDYYEHMIAQLLSTIYKGYGKIIILQKEQMSNNRNFKYIIDFNIK
ncbi:MAG: hypothetical protein WC209_09215 [Ignavibacteriaceae bacterium]|jgi:hypothetical protein